MVVPKVELTEVGAVGGVFTVIITPEAETEHPFEEAVKTYVVVAEGLAVGFDIIELLSPAVGDHENVSFFTTKASEVSNSAADASHDDVASLLAPSSGELPPLLI